MNDRHIEAIERATLDAVAPQFVEEISDWLLPSDKSLVKRAHSAVPLKHAFLANLDIASIEDHYKLRGESIAFRVADVTTLGVLHDALRNRLYLPTDPVCVLTADCAQISRFAQSAGVLMSGKPVDEWARVYTAEGFDYHEGQQRISNLSRGRHAKYFWVEQDGESTCAGVGAFSQGWASVHGLRTLQNRRGKGFASRVMSAIAAEAMENGYQLMFLQVEENNKVALDIYLRAGFALAWKYHYWHKSET